MGAQLDLSVVVIAFNEEAGIGNCLEALLHQTTSLNFEVIVVDDGSSDATSKIATEFKTRDSRVRVERLDVNSGRGAARLAGQRLSSAPRIAFVDADIIVPSCWIDTCARELEGRSAVSGIATPDGDCAAIWQLFRPGIRLRSHPGEITGNNVMFDAAALRLEPFEATSRLGEDTRLAHRMVARGMKLTTITTLVSEHREHKSYGAAFAWMWQNGVDASRLPFELKRVRMADLTWIAWLGAGVGLVCASIVGAIPALAAIAGWIAATAIVDVVYMASRFTVAPHPLRWLLATLCNVPIMSSYLAGRTFGLAAFALRPRRAPSPSTTGAAR